jgi:hypothetical protein
MAESNDQRTAMKPKTTKSVARVAPIKTDLPAAHLPQIPPAELFSFLKETKGVVSWTVRDMVKSLRINMEDAKQVIDVLQLQAYVRPYGTHEWQTTIAGETVSGAKSPRFSLETY